MAYRTENLQRVYTRLREEAAKADAPPLTDAQLALGAGIYGALVGPTSGGNAARLAAAAVVFSNAPECAALLREAVAAYDEARP